MALTMKLWHLTAMGRKDTGRKSNGMAVLRIPKEAMNDWQ
jgi:hypothetical protein